MLKKLFSVLFNKYTLTFTAFVVWIVFFDSNSILSRMKHREKLKTLKQEKHFYLDEIRKDSTLRRKLVSDTAEIEKFAREHYIMQKANEDVYLVVDTTGDRHQ